MRNGLLDNVCQFNKARMGGVQYLPNGLTIQNNMLYVSTNMDYMAAIKINSSSWNNVKICCGFTVKIIVHFGYGAMIKPACCFS